MKEFVRQAGKAWVLSFVLVLLVLSSARAEEGKEKTAGAPIVAGYQDGFFLRSEDGSFDLKLGGRLTAHGFLYEGGSIQKSDLFLSAGRLSMDGTLWKYYLVRIEGEFVGTPSLRDAYLNVNYTPVVNLRIGQFKVPFSYEQLYQDKYVDLVERPSVVLGTLKPSRDVGAMLHGKVAGKVVEYQLEVLSGAGQNSRDNNKSKDFAGRVMVAPFAPTELSWLKGLQLGIGATWGDEPNLTSGGALKGNSIGGQTPAEFVFYQPIPVQGTRVRLDGQAAWLAGPFSLKGELIHTTEERDGIVIGEQKNLPDFETQGWYVTGTWVLTGEKETTGRPSPKTAFISPDGTFGPGLVKAAVRYEVFDLDKGNHHAATEPGPATFKAWTLGLTWYPVNLIRVSVDYQREQFSDPARSPRPGHDVENVVMTKIQGEF